MVMKIEEKFNLFKEKIKESHNILIVGHLRPDGDAISSCCAMLEIVKQFNKKGEIFCSGNIPENLNYLANYYQICTSLEELKDKIKCDKDNILECFDLLIVVDCGSLNRTNLSQEIKKSRQNKQPFIIEIDHHPKVDDYSDLEIRQNMAASTTEIIYDLSSFLNIKLNKSLSECLLTGIITDTGNFFYPNASAKTLKISAQLLEKGANLSKIIKQVNTNKNLAIFKLWGLAMERLTVHPDYDFAFSVLTLKDLELISGDWEEISETLSSIAGFLSNLANVKATLLLHETAPGMIKGHLRSSNPNVDISTIARQLGGGGHPQASGFAIAGEIIKKNNNWQIK